MKGRAIVVMRHKTGTKWMSATFRAISKELDIPFHFFPASKIQNGDLRAPSIIVDRHARWFSDGNWAEEKLPEDRIFHLIRDPRDVVISGMHYHRKSPEPHLHKPIDAFEGLTYQEKINSLPDDRSRFLFEMDNKAKKTISSMSRWEYGRPECFECKYEDLIEDYETRLFAKISAHLGFSEDQIDRCRDAFLRNSLFGDSGKKKAKPSLKETHVRSGKKQEWARVFDRPLGEAFVERFPGVLAKLGYETDDSWVENLPVATEQHSPGRAAG